MAMLPPAPDLFSTITVRFAIGRSFSAKYRTRTSAPLPGGKAQMRRMSWLGYAWAWALVGIVPCATAAAIARPAQRANHFDSNFICFLLWQEIADGRSLIVAAGSRPTAPARPRSFLERLLTGPTKLRQHDQGDNGHGCSQEDRRYRPFKEHHRIAARDHQGPPEIFFHERSKNESQDQRRRLASESQQDVAEH